MIFAKLFDRIPRPRIYLASLGIPDTAAYLKLFGKNQARRVAIISTAWNVAPAAKSQPFKDRLEQQFASIGFTTEYIDLAHYGGKQQELAQKLADFSGVWVMGGNCFYLNYWMRESGFDVLLPGLLQENFVYGGESAGAVVAAKTLHGVEVLDDPSVAPEIIWNGLGLVDYGILPHWGKPKYADRYQQAYEEMRLFTPVKTLADTDFIAIK